MCFSIDTFDAPLDCLCTKKLPSNLSKVFSIPPSIFFENGWILYSLKSLSTTLSSCGAHFLHQLHSENCPRPHRASQACACLQPWLKSACALFIVFSSFFASLDFINLHRSSGRFEPGDSLQSAFKSLGFMVALTSLHHSLSPTSCSSLPRSGNNTMESASFPCIDCPLYGSYPMPRTQLLLYCLIDIGLGHIGTGSDGDVLLLAGSQVLGGYIYDTVGIDTKGNLDLRNTSSCRQDTIQTELVRGSCCPFANWRSTLYNGISTAVWLSAAVEKIWLFLVGIVVFLTISLVATPPMVSRWTGTEVLHPEEGYHLAPASPVSLPS